MVRRVIVFNKKKQAQFVVDIKYKFSEFLVKFLHKCTIKIQIIMWNIFIIFDVLLLIVSSEI